MQRSAFGMASLVVAGALALLAACGQAADREAARARGQRIHAASSGVLQAGDAASRPGGAGARKELPARLAALEAAIATLQSGQSAKKLRLHLDEVRENTDWIVERGAAVDAYPAAAARLDAARARLEPLQASLLRASTSAGAKPNLMGFLRDQQQCLERLGLDLHGLPESEGRNLEDRVDRIARDTAVYAAMVEHLRTDAAPLDSGQLDALASIEAALPEFVAAEDAWLDAAGPLMEARLTVADLRKALGELEGRAAAR